MRSPILFAAVWFLAGCQRTETPDQTQARLTTEAQTARSELAPLLARYERAVAAGDIDSMAAFLAENVRVLPPNQPLIVGRADWITSFRPVLALGHYTEDVTTESVFASGPVAVERGRYVLTFAPGRNAPRTAVAFADTGKYLWVWHKAAGHWLLAEVVWNSDRPASR